MMANSERDEEMQENYQRNGKPQELPKVGKQIVGPIEIFRFADGLDIILMILGLLASLVNGACLPLMSLILGEMSDDLIGGCLGKTNTTNYQNCTQSQEKLKEDMINDINKISDGIGEKIALLFQNISTFSIGLTIGLVKGWKLTLVTLSTSPLIIASAAIFSRIIISLTTKELNAYSKAGAVAEEVLSSVRTVVAFGAQEKEIQRYTQNLKYAKDIGIRKAIASKLSLGAVYFFMNGTYGLALWYGTSLILSGEPGYTIGTVLAVFFSVIHSSYCIGTAAPNFETFTIARGAAFSIFQVIDKKPAIDNFSTKGYKPECIEGTVEFKNVSFSYPSRPSVKLSSPSIILYGLNKQNTDSWDAWVAQSVKQLPSAQILKDLNLKIQSGETVALVGPSGSGKSTTVQLLQRLYDPDNGFIMVDGNDIKTLNVHHYREHIGVVSQEPVLFETTINNNIKYGRDGVTDEEIEKAAKEANAYDFIMAFPNKFNTLVGEKGAQMSGGQKQRIAIARALVRNPKILILDEATSALDTESESVVQAALEKASKGRTTIVIAHRLSTIRSADLIVTMKDGMVVEKGTHAELIAKQGLYYSLAMSQDIKKADEQMESMSTEKSINSVPLCSTNSIKSDLPDKSEESIQYKETNLPEVSLFKIFKLIKSEWLSVVLGTLAAVLNGTVHPVFSIIFAKIITMFENDDKTTLKHDAEIYSMIFVILGVICFVSYFIQGLFYGRAGEILTMRLRHLAFKAMLNQIG
ncbi:ATP-binding cassette sub-family B member 5 isoform X5 [Callorhinus ursinus]|uniref:ATP-binding cassette sub-family B member 5 isoform X5 n=1 Tax=Callorhinus ursinus TaxID=34884 RepID=UPI003CD042B5